MVWYVPPLSPAVRANEAEDPEKAVDAMRIPARYLANLLAAGDEAPVRRSLVRLTAVRRTMRSIRMGEPPDDGWLSAAGIDAEQVKEIYRLLALARYNERFVLPTRTPGETERPHIDQGRCGYPG